MQYNYFLNPNTRLNNTFCNLTKDILIDMITGNVFQCLKKYQDICIGNIKDTSIDSIWTSKKAISLREKMIKCKIPCHQILNCSEFD